MDMPQMPAGDLRESVDGRNRGGRRRHAVAREIAADVQGNLGRERGEPARLGVHVRRTVVHAGDNEACHLDVHAGVDGARDG